jgi:hypothetical protein
MAGRTETEPVAKPEKLTMVDAAKAAIFSEN